MQTVYSKGHNLKQSQASNGGIQNENSRHTIQIFNPTSIPQWSGQHQYDIKLKNFKFHELILGFLLPAVDGISGGSANGFYTPPDFFVQRIELTFNGNVMQNLYPSANHILSNLMVPDEQRAIINSFSNYKSTANRITRSASSNWYYIKLRSLFNETMLPIINNGHEFSLRIFMNSASDCVNINGNTTGSPICNILNGQLIARCTHVGTQEINEYNKLLIQKPISYLYHDYKIATFQIASGVNNTLLTLSPISGLTTMLFFTIRPTASLTKDNAFNYTKIKDFSLLDSGGSNIVGGSPISSVLSLTGLSKWWVASSFLAEAYEGTANNFVYIWSWSSNTVESLSSGKTLGGRNMTGFEQLAITFDTTTSASLTLELFAMQSNALVQSISNVTKQTAL